jgi:hypothetical protein
MSPETGVAIWRMAISKDESGKYSLCIQCQKPHSLSKCPEFRAFNDAQRVALIKKTRTCWRCIQGRHRRSECTRNWTCRDCGSVEHHTLLHGAFESKLIGAAPAKYGGPQPPPPPMQPSGSTSTPKPNMSNQEILKILQSLTAHMSMGNVAGGNQTKTAMPVSDDIIRTLSYLVAPVYLFHPLSPDKKYLVNSVFDTCAEGCFLTERVATILGLTGNNQPQILKLLSTTVMVQSRLVQIGLQSCTGDHRGQIIANTVREIQRSIKPPNMDDLKKRFPYLSDINFPAKAEGDQIDLLIGLEFFEWMAPYLVRYEGRGKPCVLYTMLGPVVMFGEPRRKTLDTFSAPVSNMAITILAASTEEEREKISRSALTYAPSIHSTIMALATSTEDSEDEDNPRLPPPEELLSMLWRYDLMGIDTNLKRSDKLFSIEEQRAWDILQDGIQILPNLALQIPIPWKQNEPKLMDNGEEVRRDVLRQELRWSHKAPEVLETADKDIQDQVKLGFIRVVSRNEWDSTPGRYLHWLLVHRPDKMSTRVRIVFDASRKAYCDGKSLNGCMLKGPSLLNEVFDVHNANREKPILVTADISKMFPRFKLPKQDRKLHRFWWQGQVYEFSSLIFGTIAAPFMANFGIRHVANKYKQDFPHVLKAIKTGIYVDDLSLSFETVEEAKQYVKDFITVFEKHDLPFRK